MGVRVPLPAPRFCVYLSLILVIIQQRIGFPAFLQLQLQAAPDRQIEIGLAAGLVHQARDRVSEWVAFNGYYV